MLHSDKCHSPGIRRAVCLSGRYAQNNTFATAQITNFWEKTGTPGTRGPLHQSWKISTSQKKQKVQHYRQAGVHHIIASILRSMSGKPKSP